MRIALAAVAAMLSACSQRQPPGPSAGVPAVTATMQRQVLNAIDAGDGDLRVRQLRHKMALAPREIGVRKELARRYQELGCPELAVEHYRLACVEFPDSAELHVL
ncbi:MAG: hypothetical protein ACRD44_18035, partial [Bryobacteraceae bacterium]